MSGFFSKFSLRHTLFLAQFYQGPAVDELNISVSGGVANFILSGADNETFSIRNNSAPTGLFFGAPYFSTSSIVSASWSPSAYPYLTFWPFSAGGGGVTAGPLPGTSGPDLFNTSQSEAGPELGPSAVVFRFGVPEPSTWAMMLLGFAGLGFVGYRASRTKVTA